METEAGSEGTGSCSGKTTKMHTQLSETKLHVIFREFFFLFKTSMKMTKQKCEVTPAGVAFHLKLLLLYYNVGFLHSLSEPHGGGFDAHDTKRSPVRGRAATRQPAALEKLLTLHV